MGKVSLISIRESESGRWLAIKGAAGSDGPRAQRQAGETEKSHLRNGSRCAIWACSGKRPRRKLLCLHR